MAWEKIFLFWNDPISSLDRGVKIQRKCKKLTTTRVGIRFLVRCVWHRGKRATMFKRKNTMIISGMTNKIINIGLGEKIPNMART